MLPSFMLIPTRILRLADVEVLQPVAVENSCDATYSRDQQGRVWIRKPVVGMGHNGLQAEALYWLLARAVGVPMPEGAVQCLRGDEAWLSRKIDNAAAWDPAHAMRVDNLEDLGGVLALDAIAGNDDRHPANILLQVQTESSMKLWAIDADRAAVGCAADLEALGTDTRPAHRATLGIPLDLVANGASGVAARAENLPRDELRGYVDEACSLGLVPGEANRVLDALEARCRWRAPSRSGIYPRSGVGHERRVPHGLLLA